MTEHTPLPEKILGGAYAMFVLAAVNRLGDNAYAAEIARLLKAHGRPTETSRVTQTLSQLSKTKMVKLETDIDSENNRPLIYSLTDSGRAVIDFFGPDPKMK